MPTTKLDPELALTLEEMKDLMDDTDKYRDFLYQVIVFLIQSVGNVVPGLPLHVNFYEIMKDIPSSNNLLDSLLRARRFFSVKPLLKSWLEYQFVKEQDFNNLRPSQKFLCIVEYLLTIDLVWEKADDWIRSRISSVLTMRTEAEEAAKKFAVKMPEFVRDVPSKPKGRYFDIEAEPISEGSKFIQGFKTRGSQEIEASNLLRSEYGKDGVATNLDIEITRKQMADFLDIDESDVQGAFDALLLFWAANSTSDRTSNDIDLELTIHDSKRNVNKQYKLRYRDIKRVIRPNARKFARFFADRTKELLSSHPIDPVLANRHGIPDRYRYLAFDTSDYCTTLTTEERRMVASLRAQILEERGGPSPYQENSQRYIRPNQ